MRPQYPLVALAACLVLGGSAGAQTGFQTEDRVDLFEIDRSLIAVDSSGQRIAELDLELGEEVVSIGSKGRLGVASTTTRLLGFRSGDSEWREIRYRVSERNSPPARLHLAERVALVALPSRVLALTASSPGWLEIRLGPGERAERVFSEANLGAVVTSRRAIAVSDESGFVEIGLGPNERIETSSARESSISLATQRRLLVFRAGTARWLEISRVVNP
jgi:hypothetical protein